MSKFILIFLCTLISPLVFATNADTSSTLTDSPQEDSSEKQRRREKGTPNFDVPSTKDDKSASPEIKKMYMLEKLLDMPPEKLTELKQSIERIEAMSLEEKDALRKRISKFKKIDPAKQNEMRKAFENIPPQEREKLRKHWKDLTPEQRQAEATLIKNMTPAERDAWRKKIIAE